MNFSRRARASRMRWYSPSLSHRARIAGSFCGRPAFIGKSVRGRKTVERQSFTEASVFAGASAITGAALAGALNHANRHCEAPKEPRQSQYFARRHEDHEEHEEGRRGLCVLRVLRAFV